MLTKQYLCPKCSKTVSFLPLSRRRTCPHCGREIMIWDAKPEQQQHHGSPRVVPPKVVLLVVLIAILAVGVYFYLTR